MPMSHEPLDPADEKEIRRKKELVDQPIDFDQLIEDGILGEGPGKWYRLLDPENLPEHADLQVKKLKESEDGVLVAFAS